MEPDRDKARAVVLAQLAQRGWDKARLAAEAEIDYSTAGDFLNGLRWPRVPTLAKIDQALGWEPGTTSRIATGDDVPGVSGPADDGDMLLNVDPAVYEDLSRAELAEAIATAEAVFLQKVREIRSARMRD